MSDYKNFPWSFILQGITKQKHRNKIWLVFQLVFEEIDYNALTLYVPFYISHWDNWKGNTVIFSKMQRGQFLVS